MRELIYCWQHTRMIVLIGFCAALFVAVLLPFKIVSIVPGITEVRPAMALPIVFSIFFGPAAAWGTAFGNVIGDVLGGTIGPGSLFGFFGNLIYAYVPYRMMHAAKIPVQDSFSGRAWAVLLFSILLASGLCGVIIALGVDVLDIVPFVFLANTIILNNLVVSLVLSPILIGALQKRVRQMNLTYVQIMKADEISRPILRMAGPVIVLVLLAAVYLMLMFPSFSQSFPFITDSPRAFGLISCCVLILAALLLL